MLSLFLAVLCGSVLMASGDDGAASKWRVINGQEAVQHEFPSMVSMQYNGGHFCGATLVNSYTALTAAHCVYNFRTNNPSILSIRAGEHALNTRTGKEREVPVSRIIIHERYTSATHYMFGDDIAILKLARPILEEAHIRYVALPTRGEPSRPGDRCQVVGWGSMNPSGFGAAQRLQKADLDIISNDVCANSFSQTRQNLKNVCAGRGMQSISACKGDSGGPLYCNVGGQHVQVGIVSYGRVPCAQANIPAVFARVSTYADWIARYSQ